MGKATGRPRGRPKGVKDLRPRNGNVVGWNPVSVREIDGIRRRAYDSVVMAFPAFAAMLQGRENWTPTRLRGFTAALNKILPDLTANYHEHAGKIGGLETMDRSMLEQIAAAGAEIVSSDNSKSRRNAAVTDLVSADTGDFEVAEYDQDAECAHETPPPPSKAGG